MIDLTEDEAAEDARLISSAYGLGPVQARRLLSNSGRDLELACEFLDRCREQGLVFRGYRAGEPVFGPLRAPLDPATLADLLATKHPPTVFEIKAAPEPVVFEISQSPTPTFSIARAIQERAAG